MLHTKYMEICPPVQEEKIYEGSLPYIGVAAILVLRTNFRSPYPRKLHIKFGFDWPRRFGEEDV